MDNAGGTDPWPAQLAGRAKDGWALGARRFVNRRGAGGTIWALVGLVAVGLLVSGCGRGFDESEVHSVIRAERFEVVDQDENTRAVLTMLDDGRPSLILMDTAGEFRAWLFLSQDGSPNLVMIDNPRLVLMDATGEPRSVQRFDENGSPTLSLRDEAGVVRVRLGTDEGDSSTLELFDDGGDLVWSAP